MSLKAFELISVVDNVNLGGDKVKSSITCMELAQDDLYLGTSDSFVVHFAIEQGVSPAGKSTFMNKLQRHKHLGLRKPISQLVTCAAIGQLLVLCEGSVYAVSMYGLELREGPTKDLFRGVTVIARNNTPPIFSHDEVQICVGTKRKSVQVYTLTHSSNMLLKEINLTDPPSVLAIDGECICTTLGNQYFIINYVTSVVQELFMYERHNVLPKIKRVGYEEFLLNGPTDAMGMIVNSKGLSTHQPLTWPDGFRSVAYCYPYMLVLGNSTVTVHSILDQKQKQAMSFTGGVLLNDFGDLVLVALEKSVMSFAPVPYSKQIQMLLIDKRVDEAFDLLLVASKLKPKEYNEKYIQQIQMQAGFIHFANADFARASELFVESSIDPREVIILYPLMMPANKTFTPSRPLLHNIKDLTVVVKGSKTVFAAAKKFLLKYLEICRNKFPDCNTEVDTVLMKLYAECNHPMLSELLSTQNACYFDETVSWLTQFKRFHCLALYYCYVNQPKKSLEIWRKLIKGGLVDNSFPGVNYVVKYLSAITDEKLIWDSSPWLLDLNQELAVKIFTDRTDDILNPDSVCSFLQKFAVALQIYLEYLVFAKQLEKEKYHTYLAVIYVDRVLKLMKDKIPIHEEFDAARSKLRTMLETSSLYRISTLLQKIAEFPLYHEIAILYGKMEQHEKALKILVYKGQDFAAAERYCDVVSSDKECRFKQKVFHTLLNIYLNSSDDDDGKVRPEHLVMPAVRLLNTRKKEFDFQLVLQMLPEDWSIDLIKPFLIGSVRNNLHCIRQTRIETSTTRQHYLVTKFASITLRKAVVNMTEEKLCDLCKKSFSEAVSVRYPNGVLVHAHCCHDKHICPVTGTKFQ